MLTAEIEIKRLEVSKIMYNLHLPRLHATLVLLHKRMYVAARFM